MINYIILFILGICFFILVGLLSFSIELNRGIKHSVYTDEEKKIISDYVIKSLFK